MEYLNVKLLVGTKLKKCILVHFVDSECEREYYVWPN